MKSFKQFLSESINVAGDFNGTIIMGNTSQPQPTPVGEEYVADITWKGNLYRLSMVDEHKVPTKQEVAEMLQADYPGAIVQNIYPAGSRNPNIKGSQRYQPERLTWSD